MNTLFSTTAAVTVALAPKRQSDFHSLNPAPASFRKGVVRGNPAMKTVFAISAAAALMAVSGAAVAEDQDVVIQANAPVICSLPTTFAFHSSTAGASSGQFVGTTWNIPASQLAAANGSAVTAGEIAMRVRGTDGVCNTSHTIEVSSSRGGLTVAGDASSAPAPGFAKRRPIVYEAYWVASGISSSTVPMGPKAVVNADIPGESGVASYVVSDSLAPPGNRSFDIRIGMNRGAMTTPLLAGTYSDTVTVTLSPQ